MNMIILILSLPTENATARQRAWRALKAAGAAVLRDGVYLMPDRDDCRTTLNGLAKDVRDSGGTAHVVRVEEQDGPEFTSLFDRGDDYADLITEVAQVRDMLAADTVHDLLKQVRKLRKAFANLAEIDYFPGEAQQQTDTAIRELELACARTLSPDEPQAINGAIQRLLISDYQGRTWATRHRPWVDRLASAWLIRRFIDQQAQILWLASPDDCPPYALGFDFDGAAFTHAGSRVTFEVLLASFELEQPPLLRMGALVHYLDVGGVQPAEAAGVEGILAGMRESLTDDDRLLAASLELFDGLYTHFSKSAASTAGEDMS